MIYSKANFGLQGVLQYHKTLIQFPKNQLSLIV